MASIPGFTIPQVWGMVYKDTYHDDVLRYDLGIHSPDYKSFIEDIEIEKTDYYGLKVEVFNLKITYYKENHKTVSWFHRCSSKFLMHVYEDLNDIGRGKMFAALFGAEDVK